MTVEVTRCVGRLVDGDGDAKAKTWKVRGSARIKNSLWFQSRTPYAGKSERGY
jgi:hypothetical protein